MFIHKIKEFLYSKENYQLKGKSTEQDKIFVNCIPTQKRISILDIERIKLNSKATNNC